jgi:hypothetical protein
MLVFLLFCIIVWLTPSALAIGHFRFSLSGVQVIPEFTARKCQIIVSLQNQLIFL